MSNEYKVTPHAGHVMLQIPIPLQLSRRRGVESLHANGRAVAVRMHEDDLALLHSEADKLGITRGELMRWLCVYGAAALHKLRTGTTVEIVP